MNEGRRVDRRGGQRWAAGQACAWVLAAAVGCGGSTREGARIGGETNWLVSCQVDGDCAVGQCLCGKCTAACSGEQDRCSDGPPESRCVSGEELPLSCPVDVGTGVCLPPPAQDTGPGSSLLDEALGLLVRDLEGVPAQDRASTRYLSVANLRYGESDWNDEERLAPPGEAARARVLEVARAATTKLANSLSRLPVAKIPETIDVGGMFQRIDLRDYGWAWDAPRQVEGASHPDGWEAIVARATLAVEYQGPAADRLKELSGARVPWLFADDFVVAASLGETYYELLDVPQTLNELRFELAAERSINQGPVYRGAFENSGVSKLTRVVERSAIGLGMWQAFDFRTEERGAGVYTDPMRFEPETTEVIFTLPNGLNGFFVANEGGQRLRVSPLLSTYAPDEFGGLVDNAISCLSCHNGGLITFTDELRSLWEPSPGEAPSAEQLEVLDAYPEARLLQGLMDDDNRDYNDALRRAGMDPREPDPVTTLYVARARGLSTRRAAGELWVTPERMLDRASELPVPIWPQLESGLSPAPDYALSYSAALCMLHQTSENRPVGCP